MSVKKYYFNISIDYRSGPRLEYYDNKDEMKFTKEERYEFSRIYLNFGDEDYISYIIVEDIYVEQPYILLFYKCKTLEESKEFILQTYCMINACTPATRTDNKKGFFGPEIPISYDIIKNLNLDDVEGYLHGVTINNLGKVCHTLCITPAE